MPTLRLTVQNMTPLLMYGADNKDPAYPELRATSIRGILRYWLRAVLGAQYQDGKTVYQHESAILGSTDKGSAVTVRVQASSKLRENQNGPLYVMPKATRGYALKHDGYEPDGEFRITLSTHPLAPADVLGGDLLKAVYLMVYMGGLGKRSRRGSGNLRVVGAKGETIQIQGARPLTFEPADGDELVRFLGEIGHAVSNSTVGRRPTMPTFAPDTAVVLAHPDPFGDYEGAFDHLWRTSGPYHSEGGIFGDVRPRRSSAIHMRVGHSQDGVHPQMTILYSGAGNWRRMQQFIDACLSAGYQQAYGGDHWRNWS